MLAPEPLAIDPTKENDILKIYPCGSLLSSSKAKWDGIHLGYYRLPATEIPENRAKHHQILIHTDVPPETQVEQRTEGHLEQGRISNGDIVIVPANTCIQVRWDTEHSYIVLNLDPMAFARSVDIAPDSGELLPHFLKSDLLIMGIGLTLKSALENGKGDRLYIDSLTNALSAHLLQHYSARKAIAQEYAECLPKYKLRQVTEYINEHLERNLTLAELAAVVHISPNYFSRLFKHSTGLAPHQYLIQRRIVRAKQLLHQGELPIAQIAYSLGFSHQSHLNRHFKRLVGVTPKGFRQQQ